VKGAYGTLGDLAGALHAHIDMAGTMRHFKDCRSGLQMEGLPRHASSGVQKSRQDSISVGSKLYIWGPLPRGSEASSGIWYDVPVTVLRVFPADRANSSRKVVLLAQDGANGATPQLVPLDVCVQRMAVGRGRGQQRGMGRGRGRYVNNQFAQPRQVKPTQKPAQKRNLSFI
jgi:hypothetical protein